MAFEVVLGFNQVIKNFPCFLKITSRFFEIFSAKSDQVLQGFDLIRAHFLILL